MRRSYRIPGPIAHVGVGSTKQIKQGQNEWSSVNPLDAAQGWTFHQSAQANIVTLTTSASGIRVQQDIAKNANSEARWNHSVMRSDRYYTRLRGPDGELTWSDNFTLEFLVELVSVGSNTDAPDKSGMWVGLSDAEVETGTSAVAFAGCAMYFNNYQQNTSQPSAGMMIGGDSNTTSNASATFRKAYVTISPVIDGTDDDGNPQTRQVSMQMMTSANELIGNLNSGTQTFEYNADTQGDDPVYLFVSPCFFGANGSNNTDTVFKVWYRLSMTDLSPTYNPITG